MSIKSPERLALEERAKSLNLKTPGNIGDEKLAKRIAKFEEDKAAAGNSLTANDPPPQPDARGKVGTVTVVGPKSGRRRAGRHFGQEPVEIPIEDLVEEDLETLMSDPLLLVSIN